MTSVGRSVSCRICYSLDYTHPDVFEGVREHSIETEMWSLGIVAHFALFGTNPYYMYLRSSDRSGFLKHVCMRRCDWKRLGPKMKRSLSASVEP